MTYLKLNLFYPELPLEFTIFFEGGMLITKGFSILLKVACSRPLSIAAILFSGFFAISSNLIVPLLVGKYYQMILDSDSQRGKIVDMIFGEIQNFNQFLFIFLLTISFKLILTFLYNFSNARLGEYVIKVLRERLLSDQMLLEYQIFEKKDVGNYLLRYSGDLDSLNKYLTKGILGFVMDLLFLIMVFLLFVWINAIMALAVIIGLPVLFLVIYLSQKQLTVLTGMRRDLKATNLGFVSSLLNSLLTIKVYNRHNTEMNKFKKKSSALYTLSLKYQAWYAFFEAVFPFLLYFLMSIVMLLAYKLRANNIDGAELGAQILVFIMLLISIQPVMRRILKINLIWQSGNISLKKIIKILEGPKESIVTNPELNFKDGSLKVSNLNFNINHKQIFNSFSFTVPGYGIYQINGAQGTGKTMLFKILTGIYKPQSGLVLISDNDQRQISEFELRKQVTAVMDDLPLLGKTIFEAISYSRKEEKKEAAKNLLDRIGFFEGNNLDVDTQIKNSCSDLSSGQRKLLKLARAFLTNKKYILLDEPFSDLSEHCSHKLVEYLNSLRNKRTILVAQKESKTDLIWDGIITLNN